MVALDANPVAQRLLTMKAPPSRVPFRGSLLARLFPSVPRSFPWRRGVRTMLRAAHILTGGVLVGGVLFDQPPEVLSPWVHGMLISGFLLLATDLYASFAILCEVRGASVLTKLGLTALVPVFWGARLELLIAALLLGAVSSHMPGRYRHRVLFLRGRIAPDTRRG
jgi:hypothetical protein